MIVTLNTLEANLYNFATDSNEGRLDDVIAINEPLFLDDVMSPQLADVFNTNPDAARFDEIREGWIDEYNVRQKGLDWAANQWCAAKIILDGYTSIVDGMPTTKKSENMTVIDDEHVLRILDEASQAAYQVTCKIASETDVFTEYTEGKFLGYFSSVR